MPKERIEKLQKYKSVFDEMDVFVYENEDGTADIEFWSPAGEDMFFTVDIENFTHNIYEEYDNFDIDEHIEMWIEARKNGVAGIPSVRRLVKDSEDISDFLLDLFNKCNDVDKAGPRVANLTLKDVRQILEEPKKYVTEGIDLVIVEARIGKDAVYIFIGCDDKDGQPDYYLLAESDESSAYYTPEPGETLFDVYKRVFTEWILEFK